MLSADSGLKASGTAVRDLYFQPGRYQSGAKPAQGKFLVASRNIADPRFKETVILLVQYGTDGAMGLLINRPSDVRLNAVFPEIKELRGKSDTVFVGGPVARNQVFMLIRSGGMPPEGALTVFRNVYMSSSMAMLRRMAAEDRKGERFRVYDGYSGWGTGQLEREVSRGDWHVMPADSNSIFDKDPSGLWQEFIQKASMIQVKVNSWETS